MTNKQKYAVFCQQTYIPIYSQPWWIDAICGKDGWDVWLYETGGIIKAAMPYYIEHRSSYAYLTKIPLTQTNGILFDYEKDAKQYAKTKFENKVITEADSYIQSLNIDVYEQQYNRSFQNWSPFFWKGYSCMLRYTYVINNNTNADSIYANLTSNYRKNIKKAQKSVSIKKCLDPLIFYQENNKVYQRQGIPCPFSEKTWLNLYHACKQTKSGTIFYAVNQDNQICSVIFVVYDAKTMYLLMGGTVPEFSQYESYNLLIWHCINEAMERGLDFDFEGSMIERIAKSFMQFGATPKPYYRIRKVFNPEIILAEANEQILTLEQENNS